MSEICFKRNYTYQEKEQDSYKTKLCPSGNWYDLKI